MGKRQGAVEDMVAFFFGADKRRIATGHTGFKDSWLSLASIRKKSKRRWSNAPA